MYARITGVIFGVRMYVGQTDKKVESAHIRIFRNCASLMSYQKIKQLELIESTVDATS